MLLPPYHRPRRRSRFGVHLCAAVAAVFLLLFSVVILHNRLGLLRQHGKVLPSSTIALDHDSLVDDSISDSDSGSDRIDELDIVDEDQISDHVRISDAKEIMIGGEAIDSVYDNGRSTISRFYFDQSAGAIRLPFDRKSVDRWDDDRAGLDLGLGVDDRSKVAVASDDVPVEEEVRRMVDEVRTVEDALLLNIGNGGNPLREGWGAWFDKKGDFLRRDRMFKADFDLIDPLNNPLLHDPDAVVVTGLTKGDKLVQKMLMNEMKKTPFDFRQNHLKEKIYNVNEMDREKEVESKSKFKRS